jgi:cytochrome c oxidase assembly factor CtaG
MPRTVATSGERPLVVPWPGVSGFAAYPGRVPPLTATRLLTAWTPDIATVTVVLTLTAAYAVGVRHVRRTGQRWPSVRTLMFVVGAVVWAVVRTSFLGAYDTVLFWPRAIQSVLLLMVVPLFLALGMPVSLLMRALPRGPAARLRSFGSGRVARLATFPGIVSILLLGTPFVLFFTPVFDATLRGGLVDVLVSFWLVGIGWLYYWTRLQVDPVPRQYPALVSMWITFAEVIFDGGLGLYLMFGDTIIGAGHYAAVRDWGPSLRNDQATGGAAFWIIGDLSGLPFLAALFRGMVRDDARRAAEIDRALDDRDAALPHQPADAAEAEPDDGMQRPWWETDPSRLRR